MKIIDCVIIQKLCNFTLLPNEITLYIVEGKTLMFVLITPKITDGPNGEFYGFHVTEGKHNGWSD